MADLRDRLIALVVAEQAGKLPAGFHLPSAMLGMRMALDELSSRLEDTTDAPHHVIRDLRHELAFSAPASKDGR